MAFSGALTLTDLNDYLGPSQACIKPVVGPDAPKFNSEAPGGASTSISIDAHGDYYEAHAASSTAAANKLTLGALTKNVVGAPRARTKLEAAQISLDDCLACSGCVTSAESVLVGLQSTQQMIKRLKEFQELPRRERPLLVASIAPQVLASLSARYTTFSDDTATSFNEASSSTSVSAPAVQLPSGVLLRRISHFLKTRLSFEEVHDTSFARLLSLRAHAREFETRRAAFKGKGGRRSATTATPELPMLASACPGWVCYAEKTHGELLPLLARTRSPQQMAGLVAKQLLPAWRESGSLVHPGTTAKAQGSSSRKVYHVAIMPCYDKKLEASRPDFSVQHADSEEPERDVDCVLTTGELDTLMQQYEFDICAPLASAHGEKEEAQSLIPSGLQAPGSSSGGYLFSLLQSVWSAHLASLPASSSQPEPELEVRTIRSADYTEYTLRAPRLDGQQGTQVLFRAATCYGFRNLQNLVRRVAKQTGLKAKGASARAIAGSMSGLDTLDRLTSKPTDGGAARRGMVRRGMRAIAGTVVATDDEEGYDYIEVMACPGGCVNGGGQLRPPTLTSAQPQQQSLVARALAATNENTEAMPDALGDTPGTSTPAAGVESGWATPSDEEPIEGWKGTSREWVRIVEAAYWRAFAAQDDDAASESAASVHALQALGLGANAELISNSIRKALVGSLNHNASRAQEQEALARLVEHQLRRDQGEEALLTRYKAVSDEAVSGLAVQW